MSTNTTNHLHIAPLDRLLLWLHWHKRALLTTIIANIIGLALGVALYHAIRPVEQPLAVPTPPLPIIIATPVPPTPAAVVQTVRYVVAFDAPNGTALGPIPQPPLSAVLARWGSEWVMVPWESGNVWLRAVDVGLPDVADMQPAPAPVVVERPVVVFQQPASAPAPAVATPEAPGATEATYQAMSVPEAAPARDAAQEAERQANIQGRMVDPDVAREWARVQWEQEHCVAGVCQ